MTIKGGAAPYSNSWKDEEFDTSNHSPFLKISHGFWSHTVQEGVGYYLVSHVRVENTGPVPLKDVKVYFDVDDNSRMFDAFVAHSDGRIPDPREEFYLSFGDLAAGQKSTQKSYWWTMRERFPGVKGDATKEVEFTLVPYYVVDYRNYPGTIHTSVSTIDKA